MSGKTILFPYSDSGNLCHYARTGDPSFDWRPAVPFNATLIIRGIVRGRSAAYFSWDDLATGHTYAMFMTDMVTLIAEGDVRHGAAIGLWVPVKRGQNFGIKWAGGMG